MQELTPIRSLTDSEVVRELLSLAAEAGPVERRLLLRSIYGDDRGVANNDTALAMLRDGIGELPGNKRRTRLVIWRRWVVLGQREYTRIDLSTERRQMALEALCEDIDAVLYRSVAELQGKPDGLLERSEATMNEAVENLLRREML